MMRQFYQRSYILFKSNQILISAGLFQVWKTLEVMLFGALNLGSFGALGLIARLIIPKLPRLGNLLPESAANNLELVAAARRLVATAITTTSFVIRLVSQLLSIPLGLRESILAALLFCSSGSPKTLPTNSSSVAIHDSESILVLLHSGISFVVVDDETILSKIL